MLQQNNNNNHPCLDMANRELLHDCRRPSVSFTSALEFGAIPLIKGLRAWAVSGGYSKARRKTSTGPRAQGTCQPPPENRVGQGGWSSQVSSGYGETLESTASTRTPRVRQSGLGALVTVATLKGTEGGSRQTQTRCLFLKAQGRGSYIYAVGNHGPGTKVAGARTHTVILEGAKPDVRCSSRGPKVSHDGTDEGGMLKAKPRAIRKWRKCSKTTGSAEKKTLTGGKGKNSDLPCESKCDDKKNAVISEETINRTSGNTSPDRIKKCLTEKNWIEGKGSNTSSSLIKQQNQEELSKDKIAHLHTSMHNIAPEDMDPHTSGSPAKSCANTDKKVETETYISSSKKSNENLKRSMCANDNVQGDTDISKCDNDLNANDYHNIETNNKDRNLDADVPKLEEFVISQTTFDSLGIKLTTTNCNTEPGLGHPATEAYSEGPVNNIQENSDQESRTDECSLNCENQHSVEIVTNATQRGGTSDTTVVVKPEGYTRQRCSPSGDAYNTMEKKGKLPTCSLLQEELISDHEKLEVQQSDKSSSHGFSTPTAIITVSTIQSLPNPAPTTTAAIATAIPALSMRNVEARGGDLLPLVNSELPSGLKRVDDQDKVATHEGSPDSGEGEEDEFGAFMQASGEQLWTACFTELQQLAAGEDYNSEKTRSCTGATEPTSWKSDWMTGQPFQQSESTWIAFSQESVEQKKATDGQWWPCTIEKPNPSLSPLHNVSSVFLEAFPPEKAPCEDSDYIPTLKQLLQEQDENGKTGEQSLLDGLQDLDRMTGLYYKRAESLSCKLLLQSLHLERPNSESVTVRMKASARFSPNLPTSNQQLAASAKRRLSYDFNRNITT